MNPRPRDGSQRAVDAPRRYIPVAEQRERHARRMRDENVSTFRRRDAALTGWRRRRVAYLLAKLAAQMEAK